MEELKFEELELCPEILKAVKHMGFEEDITDSSPKRFL